jgi:flagella basal body P-ring formation protein FlgA
MLLLLWLLLTTGLSAVEPSLALPASLPQVAEEELRRELGLQPADLLEIERFPLITIPAGAVVGFSLKPGQPRSGHLRAQGEVVSGQEKLFTFDFNLKVTLNRTVFLLKAAKTRGEPVTSDDIVRVTRDITFTGDALTNPDCLNSLEAASFIPAGVMLTKHNTNPMPDVRRGDTVTVEVVNGRVRLETMAVARESGRIGERIMCRNPSSGEVFQAEIRSRNSVLVNLEVR